MRTNTPTCQLPGHRRDRGFTLVEILIVIVILGVLATVSVFAIRGTTSKAESNACQNESKTLYTTVEAYFVEQSDRTIAATGAVDGNEYERTLVDAGILKSPSDNYDIDAAGELTATANGICA